MENVCEYCGNSEGVYATSEDAYVCCEECEYNLKNEAVNESSYFDKFMDNILISENKVNKSTLLDSPQRVRAARHQDRPNNKIKYGRK